MDMWPPRILNELAQPHHSVIIYNNRGTGNTSTGTKDYSINQLAKDAADLLNSLDIEKAHVIGWSMGSYIAAELGLYYPDKVRSLILYGSGPGGDKAIPSSADLMQTLGGVAGTPEEQARQILSFFFLRHGSSTILITLIIFHFSRAQYLLKLHKNKHKRSLDGMGYTILLL